MLITIGGNVRYGLLIVIVILASSLFNGSGCDDDEPAESLEHPATESEQEDKSSQNDTEKPITSASSEPFPDPLPDSTSSVNEMSDHDIKKTVAKYFTDYMFQQGLQYIYDANDFSIEAEVTSSTHRYVFVNLRKGKNSNLLKINSKSGELEGYCILEHVAVDDGEIIIAGNNEYLLFVGHTDHPDYRDEYDSYYGDIREYYAIRYGSFFLVQTSDINSTSEPIDGWRIAEVEVQLHEDMNSTITSIDIIDDDTIKYEKHWEGLSENGIFEVSLESLFPQI